MIRSSLNKCSGFQETKWSFFWMFCKTKCQVFEHIHIELYLQSNSGRCIHTYKYIHIYVYVKMYISYIHRVSLPESKNMHLSISSPPIKKVPPNEPPDLCPTSFRWWWPSICPAPGVFSWQNLGPLLKVSPLPGYIKTPTKLKRSKVLREDLRFAMFSFGRTTLEQREPHPVDMNHESSWLIFLAILGMAYEIIPI